MMKSKEVTIPSAFPLGGTLTIPSDERSSYPAVLIIMGSGKGDRDGNLKKMTFNIYRDLAEFLSSKGFITLRYDKRGTHKSEGNFLATGLTDLIDDAVAGVNFLKNHSQVDKEKVLILGHSEGALIAPAVHEKSPVSGLILLAGAADASKDMLPKQNELAFAEIKATKGFKGWLFRKLNVVEKSKKQNKAIFKKVTESDKDVFRIKGVRVNAKWLRETLAYDVRDYLKEVTVPVLAITGEKDVQVPPEDVKRIAELVNGEAEWHIIPNMNHLFRKYEGQHTMLGLLKEYKTLVNKEMDKDMLEKMDSWLRKYYLL
ncbi:hypothetical protein HNQ94_000101 [Salirhabdus euzebyi]|uniref:Serine aminopeptidase S33 domain-containing protein n=1 Tax=Salirhabdus euzebyi TaxID=394506 RepID=A0A841PSB1_9BACI|nr:alpha/beta hydrolase [Salirhabdus euzebyi]MBB6451680.1 hypothetical protein [Salirhabdus euzebyi]